MLLSCRRFIKSVDIPIFMGQVPHSLEKTVILDEEKEVWHYTCNPPKLEVLKKFNITPIGDRYGCSDPREVLLIPFKTYNRYGLKVNPTDIKTISEVLLRKIDNP